MDTVESKILSQGVRNGTSIYLKDENADTVVASMSNVVSAAQKGGDLSKDGDDEILLNLILWDHESNAVHDLLEAVQRLLTFMYIHIHINHGWRPWESFNHFGENTSRFDFTPTD